MNLIGDGLRLSLVLTLGEIQNGPSLDLQFVATEAIVLEHATVDRNQEVPFEQGVDLIERHTDLPRLPAGDETQLGDEKRIELDMHVLLSALGT